jgi:hypothetical protein
MTTTRAVAADSQQTRLGHRGRPDPGPEHQDQAGRDHGHVEGGHRQPGHRQHAEPVVRTEEQQGERGDRDQQQALRGRDPAAAGVAPAAEQGPDQPGARRVHPQEQPHPENEEQASLRQHEVRAPGIASGQHQPVQDLIVEAVVVGLGQDEPEGGLGEHGVRNDLGGEPRGPGHQGARDDQFGHGERVHGTGHGGGHHGGRQEQQTPAAVPDAPPQATRTRAPVSFAHQHERDASDRQQQHNRENHDLRLLPVPRIASILVAVPGRRYGAASPVGVVLSPLRVAAGLVLALGISFRTGETGGPAPRSARRAACRRRTGRGCGPPRGGRRRSRSGWRPRRRGPVASGRTPPRRCSPAA